MTSLLQELTDQQDQDGGWLSPSSLKALATRLGVPLHRLESLASFYTHFRRTPPPSVSIDICRDLSCRLAQGPKASHDLATALAPDVEFREVSCLGLCDRAPAARQGAKRFSTAPLPEALVALDPASPPLESSEIRSPSPAVLRSLDANGYSSLRLALARSPESIRADITESGLRGMGGAAFPTGRKWDLVASQPASPRYVICNADESEPGAFKDRAILEQFPHLVIEGLALAAHAIGAEKGWIFIRHEYAQEREILERALRVAREQGALGSGIFGTSCNFELEIFVSPGGYILGEETALLECMEDRRGEPRNKPPFPGQAGLHGQPTLINNVETFAHAASILRNGTQWWSDLGRPGFSGHKFFSVSGDIEQPGVLLVPFGTPLGELLELCGGMKDGQELLVLSPGGASSNFLGPESLAVPIDFDSLQQAGSMLGSGSAVFIAEGHSLLDVGLNITRFFHKESCGKCVPCRLGIEKALEQVGESTQLSRHDVDLIREIHHTLERTSLCGLGQIALAPLLSLARRFPNSIRAEADPHE